MESWHLNSRCKTLLQLLNSVSIDLIGFDGWQCLMAAGSNEKAPNIRKQLMRGAHYAGEKMRIRSDIHLSD